MASVQELTDMLKAVEEAHAGLADIEAGRAEGGKDKRALFFKSGIQKLKVSQQDLTEAAVQKVTAREMAWPIFDAVDQASSDAAEHFAKAMQECMKQREDILEDHGKQEVRAAFTMLQRSLEELEKVARGGQNGESWKAGCLTTIVRRRSSLVNISSRSGPRRRLPSTRGRSEML